jgi:hypothetical protein
VKIISNDREPGQWTDYHEPSDSDNEGRDFDAEFRESQEASERKGWEMGLGATD